MKKFLLPILILILAFVMVSCDSNSLVGGKDEGRLIIHLPAKVDAARSLTNAQTAAIIESYYVMAWDSDGVFHNSVYTYGVNLPEDGTVSDYVLTPGTYNVLVIATVKNGFLVVGGSGYQDGVVITRGDTTEISIQLKAIEIEITPYDGRILENDTYSTTVTVNSNNPKILPYCYTVVGTYKKTIGDSNATSSTVIQNRVFSNVDEDTPYAVTESFDLKVPGVVQTCNYYIKITAKINDPWFKNADNYLNYFGVVNEGYNATYDNMFKWSVNVESETAYLSAAISWAPDPEPEP